MFMSKNKQEKEREKKPRKNIRKGKTIDDEKKGKKKTCESKDTVCFGSFCFDENDQIWGLSSSSQPSQPHT